MIHLYCGEGKGKTTAAMGLALRAAGRNQQVIIAQFLKGSDTGERMALAQLPQVHLLPIPSRISFSYTLTPQEREQERVRYVDLLAQAHSQAQAFGQLLILDEVCAALQTGLLDLPPLLSCLDELTCEVVLTGRNPPPSLVERADYITRMEKERHPYDQGLSAREGIEY